MTADLLDELGSRLPAGRVIRDRAERAARRRDWWPLARLREVRGDVIEAPDAVLLPRDTGEVAEMLVWASRTRTPVVTRGLGSGVCGAVVAGAGSVVLETSAMDAILSMDVTSATVDVQAGIRGDRLEEHLGREGMTMGHLPQSLALSSPGGWVAAWSAGQASPAYGAIEDRVLGLVAVLADGTVVRLGPRPRWTTGIDLRRLFVGAEGTLGVVTEVVLAISPLQTETTWAAFRMGDFQACLTAAREVRHADIHPHILRGWDEHDAIRSFAGRLGHQRGSVFLVGFSSRAPGLEARLAAAERIASAAGGEPADPAYGEIWWAHRLDAVETFDRVMGPERAWGAGVVLDTLEVMGLWADLPAIHRAVGDALAIGASDVGCHFSHVYSSGAALYFTFVIRASDDAAAETVYLETWERALTGCHSAAGSIAHHHGIGRVKAAHLATELGPGAHQLASRIKDALDPEGLLNPGVGISSVRLRAGRADDGDSDPDSARSRPGSPISRGPSRPTGSGGGS